MEQFKLKVTAGAGGGGGGGHTPVEDPDSLQSRAMVSIIDLLGEGQIGGLVNGAKSIFFNGTPLENNDGTRNFQGVTYEMRDGRQVQDPLVGFPDTETPTVVNVKVTKNNPSVITVGNADADGVRLIVTVPALIQQDINNGDTHGTSVSFKFEISTNGGAYVPFSGDLVVSGKTRSRYQRAYYYPLPKTTGGGQAATTWSIRMTRLSDDSTSAAVQNEIYLDSFYEVMNTRLSYPNSAVLGVKIDSSQFNSIPTRSYLVDGLIIQVPSNYDPVARTYTGVWNGTFKPAVSNNPAWILYDVLINKRYGLGQFLNAANIDAAKLYTIGKYCDELVDDGFGNKEPRFVINTSISSQVEAYRLITDLCSAFNGMGFWAGSQVQFTQDAPSDAAMAFTAANVIGGSFQYAGSSRKDRHSVVLVRWNDPTQNYKQMVEYVEDAKAVARYGVRKLETIAFGCTSRGQAARCGRWLLYTEQYQSDMVQFTVGMDAALVLPGDVIKIHDATRAGKRMGGRLKKSTLTSATLDAPVTLASGGLATISIRLPDGTFADRKIKESGGDVTLTDITWQEPLPALPVDGAIWMVADTAVEPLLARVVGISQGEDPGTFGITAVEHNPSKYDAIEKGLRLEAAKTSIVTTQAPGPITNIEFGEAPYAIAPGLAGISLDVSWSGGTPNYEVSWKRDGKYPTNWLTFMTTNPAFELENVRAGTYQFKITAVSGFGVRSTPVEASYTTVGKAAAPGDVANFQITRRTTDLLLTWDAVTDINVRGYEVRCGAAWDVADVITTNFSGTMITHDQDFAGKYYYHVRSINGDGVYSDNVSTVELVLIEPAIVDGFNTVQSGSRLDLMWRPNSEVGIVYYEVREGPSWNTGMMLAQSKSTSLSVPSGGIGSRKFWIKAVASPGIYSSEAAWVSTDVAMPVNSNVVLTADERALGWPGNKINMQPNGYDLIMTPATRYAEYVWSMDLLEAYRAQNSVFASVGAVVSDTDSMTWNTSTFPWGSDTALRHWAPDGDVDSITSRIQMSRYTGLLGESQLDAWSMNQTMTSFNGVAPTTVTGATSYEMARNNPGLRIKPGTKVEWSTVTFPATFSYQFWMVPKNISGSAELMIMELATADGKTLRLSYDEIDGEAILSDYAGNEAIASISLSNGDLVGVCITQTPTYRKLMIGKANEDPVIAQQSFAPIGGITRKRLYWA